MSEMIILGPVLEKAAEFALKHTVDRLSRRRAEAFLKALVMGLRSGTISAEQAIKRLEYALEHDAKSEVIFESYRRVCLAASRNAGPKLIGLLTATILAEDRLATESEERLLMAAESLSDTELRELHAFLVRASAEENRDCDGTVYLDGHEDRLDSNAASELDINSDLGESHGIWALKCAALGILKQRTMTTQRPYKADPEQYVDSAGVLTTYSWRVGIEARLFEHLPLLALATAEAET